MLAITPATRDTKNLTPNLLPCSIKHSGPIAISPRYWDPQSSSSSTASTDTTADDNNDDNHAVKTPASHRTHPAGTRISTFRGRKLLGRTVKVPAGYQGVVLQKTDEILPAKPQQQQQQQQHHVDLNVEDEDDTMDDEPIEVKMMAPTAVFDEFVVWGHELVPEDDDPYVKGVEEWVSFAEKMHAYEQPRSGT